MSNPTDQVEHIFFDDSTQRFYSIIVTREMQQQIKSDDGFARQIFKAVKDLHENETKENKDTNTEFEEQRKPPDDQQHGADNLNKGNDSVKGRVFSKTETGKPREYIWKYEDTNALIQSYGTHIDELDHPIQRKSFWDNVANDLVSQKYNVDKQMCHKKWNNLLRSYKNCKDKTGRAPTRFLFAAQMDEIIGDRPIHSSSYTLSSMKKKSDQNLRKEKNSDLFEENASSRDTGESHSPSEQLNAEKSSKRKSCKQKGKSTKKQRAEEKLSIDRQRLAVEREKLDVEKEKCKLIKDFLTWKNTT